VFGGAGSSDDLCQCSSDGVTDAVNSVEELPWTNGCNGVEWTAASGIPRRGGRTEHLRVLGPSRRMALAAVAASNRIVADSGEGYDSRSGAIRLASGFPRSWATLGSMPRSPTPPVIPGCSSRRAMRQIPNPRASADPGSSCTTGTRMYRASSATGCHALLGYVFSLTMEAFRDHHDGVDAIEKRESRKEPSAGTVSTFVPAIEKLGPKDLRRSRYRPHGSVRSATCRYLQRLGGGR